MRWMGSVVGLLLMVVLAPDALAQGTARRGPALADVPLAIEDTVFLEVVIRAFNPVVAAFVEAAGPLPLTVDLPSLARCNTSGHLTIDQAGGTITAALVGSLEPTTVGGCELLYVFFTSALRLETPPSASPVVPVLMSLEAPTMLTTFFCESLTGGTFATRLGESATAGTWGTPAAELGIGSGDSSPYPQPRAGHLMSFLPADVLRLPFEAGCEYRVNREQPFSGEHTLVWSATVPKGAPGRGRLGPTAGPSQKRVGRGSR